MSLLRRALVVALASFVPIAACSRTGTEVLFRDAQPLAASGGAVVTLIDYLESGRRAVDVFMKTLPEAQSRELLDAITTCTNASVRVAVRRDLQGMDYEETGASGVLVATKNGRRVALTAGHSFGAGELKTTITTLSGKRLASTPRARGIRGSAAGEGDWAILEIDEADATAGLPAVGISQPLQGELAFALGYPDRCGVNSAGRIVRGDGYRNEPLTPLVTLMRVESSSPLVLAPVAGALPIGGASGGGIFDRHGALIANLSGLQWEADQKAVTYVINACPASVVQDALE